MKYPFEDLEVRDHLLTGVYAVYPDGNHSLHVQIIESDDGFDQEELSTSEREEFVALHAVEIEETLMDHFCGLAEKADERRAESRRS